MIGLRGPASLRKAWPLVRRALWTAFFAFVGWLIISQARQIDWWQVFDSVRRLAPSTVAIAAVLAAASHALYSTFDLLGRRWTGHRLSAADVVPVTFVSYAFNLNFGALIGGVAFRYRMYSRLGLANGVIARVVGLSLVTNWLGYIVLAGLVFASGLVAPPDSFRIGAPALRALGVAVLMAGIAYLALCALSKRRDFDFRGQAFTLPPFRMALTQLAIGSLNWLIIAAVIHTLLRQALPYPTVLGVLLVAALAGVLTHVPAGLGVLEAVFIALVGDAMPKGELLAGLLAYRALYYLAPLAVAGAVYLLIEGRSGSISRTRDSARVEAAEDDASAGA